MNTRGKLFLLWGLVIVALVVVGGFIVTRMMEPALTNTLRLGNADEFPIGSSTLFDCDRTAARCTLLRETAPLVEDMRFRDVYPTEYQQAWIWLTHDAPDSWKAFLAVSPHHGCFVNWVQDKERFEEGCYGSRWTRDGAYQEGPSPRGLDSFPVRIENGNVLVDFKLVRGKNHD